MMHSFPQASSSTAQLHKQHMITKSQLEHEFLAECTVDWVHV